MTSNFKDSIAEIAQDLFNLEINTIIDENITGTKMPGPRHALIDIAKAYVAALILQGFDCNLSEKEPPGCYASFKKIGGLVHSYLAQLAQTASTAPLDDDAKSRLAVLDRINTKCAQLAAMMLEWQKRGLPDWDNVLDRDGVADAETLKLSPKELVLIRKTWELGTAQVAMQTVVQLDGDVVTRIHPRFAQAGWSGLHRVHHKGVNVSLAMWRELIGILESLISKGKTLFGRS